MPLLETLHDRAVAAGFLGHCMLLDVSANLFTKRVLTAMVRLGIPQTQSQTTNMQAPCSNCQDVVQYDLDCYGVEEAFTTVLHTKQVKKIHFYHKNNVRRLLLPNTPRQNTLRFQGAKLPNKWRK